MAFLALSGCASLGPDGEAVERTLEVGLEPRVVAGLAAHVARDHFPDADELPEHAGAPVRLLGAGGFRVEYVRARAFGVRASADARIDAPEYHEPTDREPMDRRPAALPGRPALVAGGITDDPRAARRRASGTDLLAIECAPTSTGTTKVVLCACGALARHAADTLGEALLAAVELERARSLAVRGDPRHALAAIPESGDVPAARASPLLAMLAAARSQERAALLLRCREVAQARAQLDKALAYGGPLDQLLPSLWELSDRLAREDEAATSCRRLAAAAGMPFLALLGQARLRQRAASWSDVVAGERCLEEARRHAKRGDEDAARAWLARAETHDLGQGLLPALRAGILAEGLEPRRLYEDKLSELARLGVTQERLLGLHETCLARGEELLAMHVLVQEGQADLAIVRGEGALEPSLVRRVLSAARPGAIFGRHASVLASPPR